jgi:hypothetical protein
MDDTYSTPILRFVQSGIECCPYVLKFDVSDFKGTCSYCTGHTSVIISYYVHGVPATGAHTGVMKSATPKSWTAGGNQELG